MMVLNEKKKKKLVNVKRRRFLFIVDTQLTILSIGRRNALLKKYLLF